MDLIAKRDISPGEELLLDYGDKPTRDFLQSYGFVPSDHGNEVSKHTINLTRKALVLPAYKKSKGNC